MSNYDAGAGERPYRPFSAERCKEIERNVRAVDTSARRAAWAGEELIPQSIVNTAEGLNLSRIASEETDILHGHAETAYHGWLRRKQAGIEATQPIKQARTVGDYVRGLGATTAVGGVTGGLGGGMGAITGLLTPEQALMATGAGALVGLLLGAVVAAEDPLNMPIDPGRDIYDFKSEIKKTAYRIQDI